MQPGLGRVCGYTEALENNMLDEKVETEAD